jgi:hypothetical protein
MRTPIDPLRWPVPEVLHTDRLVLRPFRLEDAPALHEALVESVAALRRHLWFLPWVAEGQTLASAEVRCRQAQAAFLIRTDLAYLAFRKDSNRLVGSIGLHRTDWAAPRTEVGYWVRTGEVGQGYACEGVNVLCDWALHDLGAIRVELVTDEQNLASRAVAERCGFTLEGIHRNIGVRPDDTLRHACIYARLPS